MNTDWEQDYWTGVNPAGYDRLPKRLPRIDTDLSNPQGEFWLDRAYALLQSQPMQNAKVLEIGCGNGLIAESAYDLGVTDLTAMDISAYAIADAQARRPDINFIVGDARTDLSAYRRNEFDYIYSHDFLCCLTDAELNAVLAEGQRISRNQFHLVGNGRENSTHYRARALADYAAVRPNPNVRFYDQDTGELV